MVASENLSQGDVLVVNTSGQVLRADATFANDDWRVIAVARAAVSALGSVGIALSGELISVHFGVAPASGQNGSLVYLSASSGEATTTPPNSSGNVIYVIGILQGADGVSTTPPVFFQPQYISRIP